MSIQGKRVELEGNKLPSGLGEYGKDSQGVWWAKVPVPGFSTAALSDHEVVEHEDGTISVLPSILMEREDGRSWHGYLTGGVWREV